MKNKIFHRKQKKKDEFKTFKDKIFSRTILLAALAVLCIWILYSFIFYGNFANWVVAAYQKVFLLDYDAALHLYQWTFRNYMEIIFIIAISIVFFIIFRIYLNWFTKYFEEVNSGLDNLMNENAAEISLSPELLPIERKMNTIRHTIAKQKNDILVTEQRKNDLIVYLAHDLKTPLASVIGYLNLLHDAEGLPENLREKYLSISLDKAERLEDLINEFFEIARFNLSDIILQYSKINLARLIEQLTFEFNPMLREKKLTCKTNIPDDIMLKCDADKIQRAFDNLLRNAVIYSFSNSVIEITANCQKDGVTIQFINHGNTIPAKKLERIFEQFYRLDTARSTESGGAGLGLAIAKEIIELHKGTITAKSEDEIIEFIVTLPVL